MTLPGLDAPAKKQIDAKLFDDFVEKQFCAMNDRIKKDLETEAKKASK